MCIDSLLHTYRYLLPSEVKRKKCKELLGKPV
jgi:hypothetical protein